jgi:hypothetical protein
MTKMKIELFSSVQQSQKVIAMVGEELCDVRIQGHPQ